MPSWWWRTSTAGASWSLDSEASGFEKLESGINARTLDFARFGQLFLDEGVAQDGTRVLSAEAVRAAIVAEAPLAGATLRPAPRIRLAPRQGQRRFGGDLAGEGGSRGCEKMPARPG